MTFGEWLEACISETKNYVITDTPDQTWALWVYFNTHVNREVELESFY